MDRRRLLWVDHSLFIQKRKEKKGKEKRKEKKRKDE